MWKPDICIYHGGCDDGFGAAWLVWQKWPDVEFFPGVYGQPLPHVNGKHVLFVDFSAKRPVIENMARDAKSIVIIDHHKTAEADLAPFRLTSEEAKGFCPERVETLLKISANPVIAWFDMEQSGAGLTWKFLHGKAPAPWLIRYIEDRDLWRFSLNNTRAVSAALLTYSQEFKLWDSLQHMMDDLTDEGDAILKSHDANIAKFVDVAFFGELNGHSVPMVNVPYHYASDTAHALLQKFPEAPFAACFFIRKDRRVKWSLRSEDAREDASAIAVARGGGGHRNAAGFEGSLSDLIAIVNGN